MNSQTFDKWVQTLAFSCVVSLLGITTSWASSSDGCAQRALECETACTQNNASGSAALASCNAGCAEMCK